MLLTKDYDRERAVLYAEKWAFDRNPLFPDYSGIGGDCTNFVSQCIYAGGGTMNSTPIFGWYYDSQDDRTASWSGVGYFYNFLVGNLGIGPYGREVTPEEILVGDVIQLGREGIGYYHSVLVSGFAPDGFLVAAHTKDAFDRPLSEYEYDYIRFLHIDGIRVDVQGLPNPFPPLYDGTELQIDNGSYRVFNKLSDNM